MPNFKPGEIVDISVQSARVVSDNGSDLVVSFDTTTGESAQIQLRPDGYGISVETVARGDWPPQPGDLWVSGEPGEYRPHWRVTAHKHTWACRQYECDYRVDLTTGNEKPYPIGLTVPAALRPLELVERPAQVQP